MRIRPLLTGLLLAVAVIVPTQALPATAAGVPTVTAISVASGSTTGGTVVTVTGTNFVGVSGVNFGAGANAAAGTKISVASTTKLTVTSPAHAAGRLNIRVITTAATSAIVDADVFTYVAPPTLSKISPATGTVAGGETVSLVGGNLSGLTVTVDGFTVPATYAPTGIATIQMPAHASGQVTVLVTTVGGSTSATYTYYGQPVITSITPSSGPTTGGTGITVQGIELGSMYKVTIGGQDLGSPYFYTIGKPGVGLQMPAHAAGTFNLEITTLGGVTVASDVTTFTYVDPAAK